MDNKKAQQLGPRELVISLVIAGVLFVVTLLIFSNVSNSTSAILDPTAANVVNESITVEINEDSHNSTQLAQSGFLTGTDSVVNVSNGSKILLRGTDYEIEIVGDSGVIGTASNFTLLNILYNNTEILLSYDYNTQSEAQASIDRLNTTVLDSFELGVIALIVLAAVAILGVLFLMGSR